MNARLPIAAVVVSATALVSIALHEVYVGTAYLDSGSIWTLGYGSTKGVKEGDKITPERALMRLNKEIDDEYAKGLKSCIKVPLHQHEFDALVSLAYNAGTGAVCRELAPLFNKALTDADYAKACAYITDGPGGDSPGWRATVKGKDCRVRANNCYGLVIRRANERAMCEGNG